MKDPKEILDSTNLKIGEMNLEIESLSLDTGNFEKEDGFYDVEKESEKEIGEALKKIRENETKFKKQLEIETDTNFYFQVVFKSPEDLQAFLKKHNIELHHDDYIFFEDMAHLIRGEE